MAHIKTLSEPSSGPDPGFLKPFLPHVIHTAMFNYELQYSFNGVKYIDKTILNLLQRKVLYVSTRNVPSCLTVRHNIDRSIQRDIVILGELGFPLEALEKDHGWEDFFPDVNPILIEGDEDTEFKSVVSADQKSSLKSLMLGINAENPVFKREMDELLHPEVAGINSFEEEPEGPLFSDINPLQNFPQREKRVNETLKQELTLRIKEEINPFDLWALQNVANITGTKMPRIFSYPGDQMTIKGKIPAFMYGKTYTGRKPIEFHKVSGTEAKVYFLLHHTHWGRRLYKTFLNENSSTKL